MSEKMIRQTSQTLKNGAATAENGTSGADTPKPVQPKRSSKKFHIETVDVSEDPLFNKDGSRPTTPSTPPTPSNTRPRSASPISPTSPTSLSTSLATPHTVIGSSSEGRPANVSDTEKLLSDTKTKDTSPQPALTNGGGFSRRDSSPIPEEESEDGGIVINRPKKGGKKSEGPPQVRYSRRQGDGKLKFDDSFYKKATVQQVIQVDEEENVESESVTDIYIPVPSSADVQNSVHGTITSAYETNLSINKLLRERHKGSLAAMGRFFGSKQKEAEAKQKAQALMPAVKTKQKKRPCHCIKPIHVFLILLSALIITAAIVTLVLFQAARKLEAANRGYEFKHNTQELLIYRWRQPDNQILDAEEPIFKAVLGTNINSGPPHNCSYELLHTEDTTDIGCFLWQGAVTVNLSHTQLDEHNMCINVHWETEQFTPLLKDCININEKYGMWYGGFNGPSSWPLGVTDIESSPYFPGPIFGNMVERFWISSKGVAVVASHDFPLSLEVKDEQICLSSWYGYSPGTRQMKYSVCRSDNHTIVHESVMKHFYSSSSPHNVNLTEFRHPIYVTDNDSQTGELWEEIQENYSFIFHTTEHFNQTNSSVADNRKGVLISPLVNLPTSVSAEYLKLDLWLKSVDLQTARLLMINGTLATLVNASNADLHSYLSDRIPGSEALVKVSESGIAHITGQHQYLIEEITTTLQYYTHNLMEGITNHTNSPIMTSVLSGTDRRSVIVSLSPVVDLGDTVRNMIQTSLMGYNVMSPGTIDGDLTPSQFIRAVQVAIFAPVIEFSDTILNYDEATLQIWRKWLKIRNSNDGLDLMKIIKDKLDREPFSPLFSPVWWYDANGELFHITDQFIFDGRFLVAPIINATSSSRTVYFPPGNWFLKPFGTAKIFVKQQYFPGNSREYFENVSLEELLIFEYIA